MDVSQPSGDRPRPYFLPDDFDLANASPAAQLAITTLVQPAYEELVLGATSALERMAGMQCVLLALLEIESQCAIGRHLEFEQQQSREQRAEREQLVTQYLRISAARQQAGNTILKIRSMRRRQHPLMPPQHRV